MRQIVTILSISLLANVALNCEAFARVISKPGFTLTLPDGWIEVPQSVLTSATDAIRKRAPKATIPNYDYGFQSSLTKNWLTYPYILIQVNNTGKVSEEELKALPKIDTNELLRPQAKNLKSLVSDLTVGQMQYDEAEKIVWVTERSTVAGVGRIQGLTALIPHDRGTLTIHAYALDRNFSKFAPIFRQIIQSAKISDTPAYAPRWTDNIPIIGKLSWVKMADSAMLGAIGGGIIGGLAALFAALRSIRHDAA